MKMIIRYNDKELEIDADNVSITLPPQPETKTIGDYRRHRKLC